MRALRFAARSLGRQRGRAVLGIVGVAAAGALMFDMLLLSRGLVVSLGQLLDALGYDVRVMASEGMGMSRVGLSGATAVAEELSRLPEIDDVVAVRQLSASAVLDKGRDIRISIVGKGVSDRSIWTLMDGRELSPDGARQDHEDDEDDDADDGTDNDAAEVIVNRGFAAAVGVGPGDTVGLRGRCSGTRSVAPPFQVRVVGIADFPFDDGEQRTAATHLSVLDRLCDSHVGEADMLLVASRPEDGPEAAVEAILRARPDLFAVSNDEVIERFERVGFAYFRQISAALATVTIAFGTLLITVLLTVSVNQRLGELAALRAIGFTRWRAASDVCWQAALLVGLGGVLAIPVGLALSVWLDAILSAFPGVPATLDFFVFEPRVLWLHAGLLAAIACGGSVYPAWVVTHLPIATTLRNEVVS